MQNLNLKELNDREAGILSPVDYMEEAGYTNPKELAKNSVIFQLNPAMAVGITPEEKEQLQPPQKEEKPPSVSIGYADLPPDAQIQLLAQIGIQANPQMIIAEKIAEKENNKKEFDLKKAGQEHSQKINEMTVKNNQEKPETKK